MKQINLFAVGHFKYPAVTESWRTFPGARLAVGWGLEVVDGAGRG
jgi:hypothetical protein